MNTVTEFRKYGYVETFGTGTNVSKDGTNGVIVKIIFPRCYWVQWENGEQNHAYHHEVCERL